MILTMTDPPAAAPAAPSARPSAEPAVRRAAAFLAARQLAHGEFACRRYFHPELEGGGMPDSSPFATTFALYALSLAGGEDDAVRRGADFLLEEREAPGVWRYWSSRNPCTIDPDVDDTCCASWILRRVAPDRFAGGNEGAVLAARTEAGLFTTWMRAPPARNDVDAAVIANVLLYLGEREETRAAADALVRVVNGGREAAAVWYYLDSMALYYMLSRAFHHGAASLGACRGRVLEQVRVGQHRDGGWGSALATGLGLCTLANFGAGASPAAGRARRHLLRTQDAEGGWPRAAFYCGPEPPGPRAVWWGSEELTTAICLEALVKTADADERRDAPGQVGRIEAAFIHWNPDPVRGPCRGEERPYRESKG
jgi:hypothetical protein